MGLKLLESVCRLTFARIHTQTHIATYTQSTHSHIREWVVFTIGLSCASAPAVGFFFWTRSLLRYTTHVHRSVCAHYNVRGKFAITQIIFFSPPVLSRGRVYTHTHVHSHVWVRVCSCVFIKWTSRPTRDVITYMKYNVVYCTRVCVCVYVRACVGNVRCLPRPPIKTRLMYGWGMGGFLDCGRDCVSVRECATAWWYLMGWRVIRKLCTQLISYCWWFGEKNKSTHHST